MTQDTSEKLQKVLARAGAGSRREMERIIEQGRVRVDGRVASLGDRVGPDARVSIDGRTLGRQGVAGPERRVLLYHKPEGEVTARRDPEGRPTVFQRLPKVRNGRWIAIGRLDINSSGLLLFTTDGELANRLMHPSYEQIRDYAVRIYGEVTPEMIGALTHGVTLDDGLARFESVEALSSTEGANDWYRVRLTEGRRREVRRLWESQGVTVSRLIRVRYGPVELPSGLRQGQHRYLTPDEVAELARLVGLDDGSVSAKRGQRRRRRR
jgi:23S rRNA pseudouridine2605 synthase